MNYKVSEITAKYLQVLADINSIYSRLTDLLTDEYGQAADQIISDSLEGPTDEFKKAVEGLLMDRIAMQVFEGQTTKEENINI